MNFQTGVSNWVLMCFGEMIATDVIERNYRFFEEATELVQACGATRKGCHELVDYVFDRPVGDQDQEVGGVMVTLAALCSANNIDMDMSGYEELNRCWQNIKKIRAKHATKPFSSPLPGESNA
jgi:hypothetical protein